LVKKKKEDCCTIKPPKKKEIIDNTLVVEKENCFKQIFDEVTETKKHERFMVIIARERNGGSEIKFFSNYPIESSIGVTELIKARIIFPPEQEFEKAETNMVM
jgi:hypothetical protein